MFKKTDVLGTAPGDIDVVLDKTLLGNVVVLVDSGVDIDAGAVVLLAVKDSEVHGDGLVTAGE